ncbi:MAG: nucleoside triphosphate pyrophosphohydrolase [Eubacteriales bacterium]
MKSINKSEYAFQDLIEIIEVLRSKEGCPWDMQQTHKSLRETVLEESYEVIEAINLDDKNNLKEELGDLLLQVVLHAQIASENKDFTINNIITTLCEKLIRRHPHIFNGEKLETKEDVNNRWEQIKKEEKNYNSISEIMKGVPKALPALIRAQKVQKKAAKVGFDFGKMEEALDKVFEEIDELKEAYNNQNIDEIDEEFGDLIFAIVNLSRFFGLNAEFSLTNAVEKFITRFEGVEKLATKEGKKLEDMTLKEMDTLWERIK